MFDRPIMGLTHCLHKLKKMAQSNLVLLGLFYPGFVVIGRNQQVIFSKILMDKHEMTKYTNFCCIADLPDCVQ